MTGTTMRCPTCGADAVAAPFCGHCGTRLTRRPGDGPAWLRAGDFVASPHESVFRPSLASTLLPQLSELTRRPFNAGLLLIITTMAVLAELRVPGGLLTVASLGLPLLVVVYWRRTRVFSDIPRWAIVTLVVLAAAIAVTWVLLTGNIVLREAVSPFDPGLGGRRALRNGLGVSDTGALLMFVPIVIVRLLWWTRRNALSGFVIGVLGALTFTAAATLTRLAPQFITAPVARNQPVGWLFFEAAVRGVTVPLTAACAGGLVGAALWFHRSRSGARWTRVRVSGALLLLTVGIFVAFAALGRADVEGTSRLYVLSWHIAMAVFGLIALRIGLQLVVLHEQTPTPSGEPFLCLPCRQVVPETEFCISCGAATRAAPSHSVAERRVVEPVGGQSDSVATTSKVWPGFAVPAATYTAARATRQSPVPVLTNWLIAMTVLTAVFVGLPALTVTPPPRYNCPPECGNPPSGKPVSTNPRFTATDGSFSVAYPASGTAYAVTTSATGVIARFTAGEGGEMQLTGEPARGRDAREITKEFLARTFPTANKVYEIPNAMVGFQPGYGEVADVFPLDLQTAAVRRRAVVVVAVKDDVALIAAGFGPFHQFGPDFGPGRPSAANVQIAEDMGRYVNSFRWRGDPPR